MRMLVRLVLVMTILIVRFVETKGTSERFVTAAELLKAKSKMKAKKSSGKSNKAGNTLPNVNKNASPSKRSTFPVKKNTPNGQGFNNNQSSKTLPGKKNNSSLGYGNKQSSNTFGNRNSQSSNSNSNKGLWDNGKQTQNKNVSNVSPKRNKVKQLEKI